MRPQLPSTNVLFQAQPSSPQEARVRQKVTERGLTRHSQPRMKLICKELTHQSGKPQGIPRGPWMLRLKAWQKGKPYPLSQWQKPV